jgi:hypothetical protein
VTTSPLHHAYLNWSDPNWNDPPIFTIISTLLHHIVNSITR